MFDALYVYALYSYANKPNKSPLRKRLLALFLWEFGHLSSPSRSCLGRISFVHGRQGALQAKIPTVGFLHFFKKNIYLFLERGEGREKEKERNINVWLPLMHPLLGNWATTQACALTGNRTGDPLLRSLMLNSLSHTSQSPWMVFMTMINHTWWHEVWTTGQSLSLNCMPVYTHMNAHKCTY